MRPSLRVFRGVRSDREDSETKRLVDEYANRLSGTPFELKLVTWENKKFQFRRNPYQAPDNLVVSVRGKSEAYNFTSFMKYLSDQNAINGLVELILRAAQLLR